MIWSTSSMAAERFDFLILASSIKSGPKGEAVSSAMTWAAGLPRVAAGGIRLGECGRDVPPGGYGRPFLCFEYILKSDVIHSMVYAAEARDVRTT